MHYRPATPEDRPALERIWREIGWLDAGEPYLQAMGAFLDCGRSLVHEMNGAPEALVVAHPGTLRYLDAVLPVNIVAAVTTSLLARKRRVAGQLTAASIADEAEGGALVSALGIFDQGFYDKLGFGTGTMERKVRFHPARLRVPIPERGPIRFGAEEFEAVHAARLRRRAVHGQCSLTPALITKGEMLWTEKGIGLGFADADGVFSHGLWMNAEEREHGPIEVLFMAYADRAQFLELMGLLRSCGDSWYSVKCGEPAGLQLQDLLDRPIESMRLTERSRFHHFTSALAYWQMRMNDLPGCLAQTQLQTEEVVFNLQLTDPIAEYLDPGRPWRGVAGDYIVTLGPESHAEPGVGQGLPRLETTVNAFTRLWLGVGQASALAYTDQISGPEALLAALDDALCVPVPHTDWDF